MSVISIDIQPESDSVHLFKGENMIPNETVTLKGHVQLTLLRPIQIRQITIQLKGTVRNIISNDILRSTEPLFDENDTHLWPVAVLQSNSNIPLVDRVTRRALNAAMGYTSASQTIVREQTHLFNAQSNSTTSSSSSKKSAPIIALPAGVTRYPFELTIPNADQLPPSILLPRHSISYELSAKLRLSSFREIAKMTYWNARSSASLSFLTSSASTSTSNNKRRRRFSRSSSSSVSTRDSSAEAATTSPAPPRILQEQQDQQLEAQQQQLVFSKQKQKMLRTIKPIHVFCHGHGSLQILEYQQRIRYRGSRERHLRYEVSMAKYLCLQKKKFDLVCHFFPLRDEAAIASIEAHVEQTEKYPLRAGRIREFDPMPPEILISKSSRPISMKRVVDPEQDDLGNLPLSIPIDSLHVAQDVDTLSLKITHKIRVIVHFRNPEVRKMSLSFPIVIGTVPVNHGNATMPTTTTLVAQEHPADWDYGYYYNDDDDDDWIDIVGADQTQRSSDYHNSNDTSNNRLPEKLPTYYDVLHEGAPPAAFIDDDLSQHPSLLV
ncbi:hypothetical protein BDB00DRAFT_354920 [Zychaea mexicana]|uniref:uncharacterized protein n=1 Tax=Zychaea mexicana TaxID=64656 RepID=UPI0022FF318C|nr:uncharacterized protein BDB00DRAFT_354920 [Zychaea mexicana]KAI9493797.1 hypothetical protein BDB00DRAFT_354920 [Zychaea mexicana]